MNPTVYSFSVSLLPQRQIACLLNDLSVLIKVLKSFHFLLISEIFFAISKNFEKIFKTPILGKSHEPIKTYHELTFLWF